MSDLCEQDNMVKIRYAGPTGNHLVGSPLRKVGTYGMHTNGDVFCVHVDDQKTAPAIFVLLEPKPELKPEPKLEPEAESVDEVGGEKRSTEKQRGRPRKEEAHD